MRTPLEVVGENAARQKIPRPQEIDDEVRAWRESWLNQLKSSRFYLDGIEPEGFAPIRAQLQLLGSEFETFFELTSVTHVITRRSLDRVYPEHDVLTSARRHGRIKVWTMEKLERFLKSLLGHDPDKKITTRDNAKLEQLLQNERLTGGPPDKDQWHRFGENYLLVWDPTNRHRPIAHKEWPTGAPQLFHDNMEGVCPFIACKAPKRRAIVWNDEPLKRSRNKENLGSTTVAGTAAATPATATPATPAALVASVEQEKGENMAADPENMPVAATRQTTVRTRRYGEIVASGIQRNSATSAIVSNAPRFQAPSRDFQALAKKEQPVKPKRQRKPRKPGVCENCYERFENIDEHILTPRHRRYASDDKNFDELDATIRMLQREQDCVRDNIHPSSQATDTSST